MLNAAIKKIKSAPKLFWQVLISLGVLLLVVQLTPSLEAIKVNNQVLKVKRAVTAEQQAKGLCCRDSLPSDQGMLFIYNKPAIRKFWMKNTRIPLDIYWLNSQKRIVHIENKVQPCSKVGPCTELVQYGPDYPTQYVLETNAGYAKTHHIKVGDQVSFEN